MSVFLTPMTLIAGLYMLIVCAGTLLLVNGSRPLRLLSNEIAQRVEQSIAVLNECNAYSPAKRSS
jgi:hypothetical protein